MSRRSWMRNFAFISTCVARGMKLPAPRLTRPTAGHSASPALCPSSALRRPPWTSASTAARPETMSAILQDVRYALRPIRLTPAFTAVATPTLALGIGVTTAVFSVVDGVLLRPLPYASAEQLLSLREIQASDNATPCAQP